MLRANREPFFPSVQLSLDIAEEQRSLFIMAFLKHRLQQDLMRQTAEEARHADEQAGVIVMTGCTFPNYESTVARDIAEFDKLLILKSRQDANAAGIVMLQHGAEKKINIEKSCAASTAAREAAIFKQLDLLKLEEYEDDALVNLLELALSYAEVGAFKSAKCILEKLPYSALKEMKVYCGKLFFKALHFGDSEFIDYLLDHGMNANWVDTGSERGAYLPLQLVVNDMSRYLINMNQLLADCEKAEEKKTPYGTSDDLTVVTLRRFIAYSNIICKLCSLKADPNSKPDKNMQVDKPPRMLASSLLVELQELMKCDELNHAIKVLFEKAITALKLIVDFYVASPAEKRQLHHSRVFLPSTKNNNNFKPERPPPGFSYF